MGYKRNFRVKSKLTSVEVVEGEPIELKIERIVNNGEPITDGAPAIYTERKDGVISAYNIRTDRFEIAAEAMDKVAGSIQAQRDNKAAKRSSGSDVVDKKETKVVDIKDGGAKPIEGKTN